MSVVGTFGNVHSGFNREVNDLWPLVEEMLRGNRQPVWYCGHSLGAAMATICAYRSKTSAVVTDPQELHTFGSPRVGCKRYIRHAEIRHYRWVHNNDIVTRVPPAWMGYRHCGQEIYLNRYGQIRKLTGVLRSRDRWRGFLGGLLKWRIDLLSDHSIRQYAAHIATAVHQEDAALAEHRGVKTAADLVVSASDEESLRANSANAA